MADETPPPSDVFVGAIDADTLQAWIRDLGVSADVLDVSEKGGATSFADAAPRDLANAAVALMRGEIVGIQVRYRFENAVWCDTVLRRGDAFHIVRTALRPAP